MLLIDPDNPKASQIHQQLSSLVDLSNLPFHVVFGGDGWMLNCIRNHGFDTPYFGINAGTVGFLLNSIDDLKRIADCLENQQVIFHDFPLLEANGTSIHGNSIHAFALNDIYVARTSGIAANLRMSIDGHTIVEKLICDGLITATSLGSTAYSSSAGGSPSHPLLSSIHITPICAHTPSLRPFIIPSNAAIEIEVLNPDRRRCQIVGDGFSYGEVHSMTVTTSNHTVSVGFASDNNFTERMVRKILRTC
jgi:NAD+ kinase